MNLELKKYKVTGAMGAFSFSNVVECHLLDLTENNDMALFYIKPDTRDSKKLIFTSPKRCSIIRLIEDGKKKSQ